MAEAARVLDFDDRYVYGSAAPARERFPEREQTPLRSPLRSPQSLERVRQKERVREAAAAEYMPGVSLFAMFGSVFVACLMVFVVLAQISYSEAAAESVRLGAQLSALEDQQRVLMMEFESVMDMKEVERYARDVLGMSTPDTHQIAVIYSSAPDRAEVLVAPEGGTLRDFGSFISSLLDQFRR